VSVSIYLCGCGGNISDTVNLEEVEKFLREEGYENVKKFDFLCTRDSVEEIRKDRSEKIVIGACSPEIKEEFFRAALPGKVIEFANLREQCSWVHKNGTEKAKKLVLLAILRALASEPVVEKSYEVVKKALVIGGGIAGITAALELAKYGIDVILVEKRPSIGGKLLKLDRIFPLNDCASCVISPLLSEVQDNPRIKLYVYSEVESIDGFAGNFKVRIRKKQTFVDWEKCIGCGRCVEACRGREVEDEFDEGLRKRKAMFIYSPLAVPKKAVHDPKACINCGKKKIGTKRLLRSGKEYLTPCEKSCPTRAIDRSKNWNPEGEVVEERVGAIIVATGFEVMNKESFPEYSPKSKRVVTALQMERILSPTGPTGGKILIEGKSVEKVVFVSCVGSRDERRNPYCSKVCCMYMLKQARLIKERCPNAEVYIFYTDIRAPGKNLEEYYNLSREAGIKILRGKVSKILEVGDRLLVRGYDSELGEVVELEADLVVLATAIVTDEDNRKMLRRVGVNLDSHGFVREEHPKLRTFETNVEGVFVAGCVQDPKDVSETVIQSKSAASEVATFLLKGKVVVDWRTARVEDGCSGCGMCSSFCPYGAIKVKERAEVIPSLCRGCGICVASCPSRAVVLEGIDRGLVTTQIEALSV